MFNKVFLIGNLGQDPELRSTTSGMSVASFSLATHRRWNDREGNRQEQTEWHNVVCFGRQAEVASHSPTPLQHLQEHAYAHTAHKVHTAHVDDELVLPFVELPPNGTPDLVGCQGVKAACERDD